jgi:hypothetical protein
MLISRQPWYHAPIVAGVASGPAAAACSAASGSGPSRARAWISADWPAGASAANDSVGWRQVPTSRSASTRQHLDHPDASKQRQCQHVVDHELGGQQPMPLLPRVTRAVLHPAIVTV